MHTNYLSRAMRQLRDQQVRFAPYEKQIQLVDSAEKLLNELDPKRTYTCKHFDLEHPDIAIFPHNHGLLKTEAKLEIYQQYCRGDSVQALARRFYRASSRIYRIINEMRAARIMKLPLDYIGNEQFARLRSEKKEAEILGPPPESDLPMKKPRLPNDLPTYLVSLYEVPLLTREQEMHLFQKMNYLKYKASALRAQLDLNQPKSRLIDRIEKLYDESVTIKNQIIRANLRLVVSIAKRHIGPMGDFFELISDGNMSLIRAEEKFDFSLGYKFSTYASWAIMKNFARAIPNVFRHRDRFSTNYLRFSARSRTPARTITSRSRHRSSGSRTYK
jgi:RNA polymerase primary sigma factor